LLLFSWDITYSCLYGSGFTFEVIIPKQFVRLCWLSNNNLVCKMTFGHISAYQTVVVTCDINMMFVFGMTAQLNRYARHSDGVIFRSNDFKVAVINRIQFDGKYNYGFLFSPSIVIRVSLGLSSCVEPNRKLIKIAE
jgi:hypothetical protein